MIKKIRGGKKITRINAGGPGSGRYPAGSGKEGKEGFDAEYENKWNENHTDEYKASHDVKDDFKTDRAMKEHDQQIKNKVYREMKKEGWKRSPDDVPVDRRELMNQYDTEFNKRVDKLYHR